MVEAGADLEHSLIEARTGMEQCLIRIGAGVGQCLVGAGAAVVWGSQNSYRHWKADQFKISKKQ